MALAFATDMARYVDFDKQSLWISAGSIAFNPLFWNIIARQEYHNRVLTKLFGGNSKTACYGLAATIFGLGLVRDWLYKQALADQATHHLLQTENIKLAAYALFGFGNLLVITSTIRLGIIGTFLGDYFGFLLDDMVTGFPFNVTSSPMYTGSTMSFLGTALYFGKPAGLFLTAVVHFVYQIALRFEDPFTAGIYAKRDKERAAGNGKKKN